MRRNEVLWLAIILSVTGAMVWLAGCAGVARTPENLKAEGYHLVRPTITTATGERREYDKIDLWVKDSREGGRVAHFCIIPTVSHAGYQWGIEVSVDGRQVWDHDAGYSVGGRSGLRTGVDCASSPDLPEGRLTYHLKFRYWQ